jgi:hypothetical protein
MPNFLCFIEVLFDALKLLLMGLFKCDFRFKRDDLVIRSVISPTGFP